MYRSTAGINNVWYSNLMNNERQKRNRITKVRYRLSFITKGNCQGNTKSILRWHRLGVIILVYTDV